MNYDKNMKQWKLDVAHSSVSETSKAAHASFTLGKQNWMIQGHGDFNDGKEQFLKLKMSGCQEDEFTCNDGQCLSMNQRCNQPPDCQDKSDERNCQILVLEDGYNKRVPAIHLKEHFVNVSVSIDLLKLVDIDEEDYSIEIQFEIKMKWKENRAATTTLRTKTR